MQQASSLRCSGGIRGKSQVDSDSQHFGLDISKIMVLARWSKEARLEHLADDVLALEEGRIIAKTIQRLEAEWRSLPPS